MGLLIALLIVVAVIGTVVVTSRRSQARALEKQRAELEPVKQLAFEDVTAFGEELQKLDLDMTGKELDEGANADYQRALDEYETAKRTVDKMTSPDDVKQITTIVEDGRYAIACVEARVAGEPLPKRRPPCFFDPRHGLSVEDVEWAPPGGVPRDVPACALDLERIRAGAEPDTRKVMVGNERVPYWQGGPAYQPYARGYFGSFGPMDWMFAGMMFGAFGGFEAIGEIGEGMGEAIGGFGEGLGDMFDGFDF